MNISTPNPELTRRRQLAEQAALAYAAQPNVAAVIIAGSVGRGTADAFSDIEVDVFWHSEPTDEEFLAPIEAAGGRLLYRASDENEWADGFFIGGIKVDTSQFLVSTMERWLDEVVGAADTEIEKQLLIAAVQHGTPIHGAPLLERWRARAATYPDALARAMVEQHIEFRPRALMEMFAARNDLLILNQSIVGASQQLLKLLMGLNRLYVAHPYFKWMDWQIAQMAVTPPDLAPRLRAVLRAEPVPAVEELHQLIEETFDLVGERMPELEIAAARAEFGSQRIEATEQ